MRDFIDVVVVVVVVLLGIACNGIVIEDGAYTPLGGDYGMKSWCAK